MGQMIYLALKKTRAIEVTWPINLYFLPLCPSFFYQKSRSCDLIKRYEVCFLFLVFSLKWKCSKSEQKIWEKKSLTLICCSQWFERLVRAPIWLIEILYLTLCTEQPLSWHFDTDFSPTKSWSTFVVPIKKK